MQSRIARIFRHTTPAFLVLALGLVLSGAASYWAAHQLERDAKAKFDIAIDDSKDSIAQTTQANSEVLHAIRGMFSISDSVSRDAFRRYVSSLNFEQRYPGILAIIFNRRVPLERKLEYEAAVRRDASIDTNGYPHFAIKPPGDRPEYFVAEYVEPMKGNEEVFGLDAGRDPAYLATVHEARDSGLITASGPVNLVRGSTRTVGFLLRLPIYQNGMPLQTVEQRRLALIGLVTASYSMEKLMRNALSENFLRRFRVRIHDAGLYSSAGPPDRPTAGNLLFDNHQRPDSKPTQPALSNAGNEDASLSKTFFLEVGRRRWNVNFTAPREQAVTLHYWLPLAVFLGGMSITLLLFGLVRSLSTVGSRAVKLAEQITENLRQSEEKLAKAQRQTQELIETLPNPIYFKGTDGRYLGVNRAWETFFGVPRSAFIGKTVHDLYPDDPETAKRLHADDQVLWDQPGSKTYETAITTPDGKRHDVIYYKATFTHADGSVAGLIGTVVDISDRKQAEAVRAQLASIVENSNDAIFSRTLDGTILSWNAGAEKMLGYTAAEVIGKPIAVTLPPNRPPNLAQNNAMLLRGEVVARESDRLTKDGRVIFVMTSHSPIRDAAGNIVGASVILQDITALKQAQAAAQASEERFRSTFDQAAVGIVHTAHDGRYLQVNQHFCAMLGYDESELVGRLAADFTHPEDRESGGQSRQLIWDGKLDKLTEEKRYIRKDGSVIWVNRTVSLARDASGKPLYFIRVIEDITQRKEAEERYRATFDNAPVGIMHTAIEDYRILRANRKLCEMLGYAQEELLGMTSTDVVHPDYRFSDRAAYRQPMLNDERQSFASERQFLRKDGSSIWVNRTVSLVRNAAGEPLYFIRIIEDITERKRAEAAQGMLAAIVENSNDAIVSRSLDLTVTSWNAAAERLFGYSAAEAIGQPIYALILPPDREAEAERTRAQLTRDRAALDFETVRRTKDGRLIDVSLSQSPINDEHGVMRGVALIFRDIRERKQAEAAVKVSEGRFRAMFENAAVGITRVDLHGVLVDVNQKFCELLGYTREELIGKAVADITHPDDYGRGAAYRSEVTQGTMKAAIGEKRFLRKDGAIIWARRTMSIARDAAGAPQYVISIVEDITERKQAEAALQDSEARYRSVIAAIAEGIVLRDREGRIIACNASAERILGRTLDQMRGSVYYDATWQAIREDGTPYRQGERPIQLALRTGRLQSDVVHGLRKADGTVLWLSMNVRPLFDESETTVSGIVSTFTDITERKQADKRQAMEHAVTRVLAEAETLAEAAPRIIQIICETMEWHCGARWQLDKEAGMLRCIECWGVDTPEIREFMAENSRRSVNPAAPSGRGLVRRIYNAGEPLWITDISQEPGLLRASMVLKAGLHGAFGFPLLLGGEVLGLMEFFHREVRKPDSSLLQIADSIGNQIGQFMARKQAEERIRHLANYDELTGLSNRSMFTQQLTHALSQAQRHDKPLAVLFVDLDRFKNINDTLGHAAGDRALKDVAERLRGCLRASDTVGRLGGDEFVVLVEEMPQPSYAAAVAQKILSSLARPFVLDDREFHLAASIGISTYPTDSEDVPSLLRNADIAMYRAKEGGRNNFQFYSAQMNVHTLERLALESDLRRALERNEFVLHYQPRIDIASERVIGMEALVRWQHPVQGLVPPMQFIPLAEETGLIVPIGAWVLKTACAQNKSWQRQGLPPLRIAVNLSARQFAHGNLVQDVSSVLTETGLDPAMLEFEITESMVMHNPEQAVNLLTELKAMGIHLAIDDFGTGYSSLGYLKRFPIDSVKVDRSFIRDLPGDSDDAAITRAIIAMAHSLKLKVIAEGVETKEQLSFLRDHACDEMQGYYVSRPLLEHEFVRLVRDGLEACRA